MPLSLNEAIKQFAETDAEYHRNRIERSELGAILADYARDTDATQKTVHLQSESGVKVDVELKSKVEYDANLMKDVAQLLGAEFDDLFETVITFKPRARPLKVFLNTTTADEAKETAKKIINQARVETEQTPYVHLAKST